MKLVFAGPVDRTGNIHRTELDHTTVQFFFQLQLPMFGVSMVAGCLILQIFNNWSKTGWNQSLISKCVVTFAFPKQMCLMTTNNSTLTINVCPPPPEFLNHTIHNTWPTHNPHRLHTITPAHTNTTRMTWQCHIINQMSNSKVEATQQADVWWWWLTMLSPSGCFLPDQVSRQPPSPPNNCPHQVSRSHVAVSNMATKWTTMDVIIIQWWQVTTRDNYLTMRDNYPTMRDNYPTMRDDYLTMSSAWKSSPKTEKSLRLNQTQTQRISDLEFPHVRHPVDGFVSCITGILIWNI